MQKEIYDPFPSVVKRVGFPALWLSPVDPG